MPQSPSLEREQPALERIPSGNPPPAGPCAMVIFGGTGDLTARKLFPALYNLAKSKLLPKDFAIVCVGRNDYNNEQFREVMGEKLRSFATTKVNQELYDWMLKRVFYLGGDFRDPQLYARLKQTLAEIEQKEVNVEGNYFFYLARSSLATLCNNLAPPTWPGKKMGAGGAWFLKNHSGMIWPRPKS
jgi:glucose-6-phosphate 1-dehydrogenase